MKISIVEDKKKETKYITAGSEKVIAITIGDDTETVFEWEAKTSLENVLSIVSKLYQEARYYYDSQGKETVEYDLFRAVALGKILREDQLRLYPMENFWQHENPIAQVQDDDVCLGLLTPHYQLFFYNLSCDKKELPLVIAPATLKSINSNALLEGVNRVELFAYNNISNVIASIVTATSPIFARDEDTKVILTQKFDQLLEKYQKPVKLN